LFGDALDPLRMHETHLLRYSWFRKTSMKCFVVVCRMSGMLHHADPDFLRLH